ncbi:MAG: hypothetical protein ACI9KK_002759 [Ascidiaceihabitans sp.]
MCGAFLRFGLQKMRIGAETDDYCYSAKVDFTLLEDWPNTWIFNPAAIVNWQ